MTLMKTHHLKGWKRATLCTWGGEGEGEGFRTFWMRFALTSRLEFRAIVAGSSIDWSREAVHPLLLIFLQVRVEHLVGVS